MNMAIGSDYSTGSRIITAYFEDRSDAVRAMDRLSSLGIPQADVRLTEGSTGTAGEEHSGGFFQALADLFLPDEDRYTYAEGLRRGGYVVSARVDSVLYDRALDILDDEGTIDIGEREQAWRAEGWTGYDASRDTSATNWGTTHTSDGSRSTGLGARDSGILADETTRDLGYTGRDAGFTGASADRLGREEAIPVAREELRVGKRDVTNGRVRVRSYVIEEPVHESVTLRQERVDVERRPADRAATAADDLFRERTIELEEHGEEAVVSKEARVTEEVVLRKQDTERTEEVADTVRRTEVEIEDDRGVSRDTIRRDR
jgi:uncharacterized protein (TIGR02271 family)